ncbi:MAG TPA: fatty acid synthase subunit beta domain-containing protein, partial [Polyangiaceae bacterium]
LLVETYAEIRRRPNLILCVGGGVASEGHANTLLTGEWALEHALVPMPVDAVFLGTALMVCLEAETSPAVKRALARAEGTTEWVPPGQVKGGVTSGKSALGADIHYLDNVASRTARLLDEVAAQPSLLATRREQVVAALAQTAKPYFGELAEMSYRAVLERMIELMACGRAGRYEDGVWLDVSYRLRFRDFVRRAEARLAPRPDAPFASLVQSDTCLDAPADFMARFLAAHPLASETKLHLADVEFFVEQICRRPGKPVNFVPRIDADVRAWYKSDSLWQAHDARFDAQRVLVLPGPAALRHTSRVDEPVAELLRRFESSLISALQKSSGGGWPTSRSTDDSGATRMIAADASDRAALGKLAAEPGIFGQLFREGRVLLDGRFIRNPVRDICRYAAGWSVRGNRQADGAQATASIRIGEEELSIQCHADVAKIKVTPRLSGATTLASWSFEVESRAGHLALDTERYNRALAEFFRVTLLGPGRPVTKLFDTAVEQLVVDGEMARAYANATGAANGSSLPGSALFAIGGPTLFSVLLCQELQDEFVHLVHTHNAFEWLGEAAIEAGDAIVLRARVVALDERSAGRVVQTRIEVLKAGEPCLVMNSTFLQRAARFDRRPKLEAHEHLARELRLNEASASFLNETPIVRLSRPLEAGELVRFELELDKRGADLGQLIHSARGRVTSGGAVIGSVSHEATGDVEIAPLRAVLDALSEPAIDVATSAWSAVGAVTAPIDSAAFADVSTDHNPLHTSRVMAALAGFEQPILHGMWTLASVESWLARNLAEPGARRIQRLQASLLSPVFAGDTLHFETTRRSVRGDIVQFETAVDAVRAQSRVPIVRGTVELAPLSTVYVFPGQGIQCVGMGMSGYARSAAARDVWEQADRCSRRDLGISVLALVRDNPREVAVEGVSYRHPLGVLNLTQFTQMAMAVLAHAQVAELREAGTLCENAITCGHSVGEYNAVGALLGLFPLEIAVQLVFRRGLAMHKLVSRDGA